jgi:CRISPR-associated protein Csx3
MMSSNADSTGGSFLSLSDVRWVSLSNASGLTFDFFPEGGLHAIRCGTIVINHDGGSPLEGGIQQVYLRHRSSSGWRALPLTGPLSAARFHARADHPRWLSTWDDLDCECRLGLHESEPAWCWTVRVTNRGAMTAECDALHIQDVGLAPIAALRASEAFVSHYLDHHVVRDPRWGYVVRTRQNQPREGRCPALLQGCSPGAIGYSTDGMQFFGLEVRSGRLPAALAGGLPSSILQGEMAAPALQSIPRHLEPGETAEIHFWAWYLPESEPLDETSRLDLTAWQPGVDSMLRRAPPSDVGSPAPRHAFCGEALNGDAPGDADLREWFTQSWRHEERWDGRLLSFFHGEDRHVVLPHKETAAERPHGHILRSGADLYPAGAELSSTCWMFGVFHSYVTLGNLSFNRFLSICRNPLNLQRAAGQRLFIRDGGGWRRLAVPSAFDIGRNDCRWIYKLGARRVTVEARVEPGAAEARLEIHVAGDPAQMMIVHEIVAGCDFMGSAAIWNGDRSAGRMVFTPDSREPMAGKFPDSRFEIHVSDPDSVSALGGDEGLYDDGIRRGYPYAVIRTRPVARFSLTLGGRLTPVSPAPPPPSPSGDYWERLTGGLRLVLPGADDVERINDMLKWHAHAAMIHYLSPHGLEQYTGGAWGVRDVCQGPVEFLLALRKDDAVRRILRNVFSRQYADTALWPQWFMFDEYSAVQSRESHGDIVLWPLKALCDYVEITNDLSVLEDAAPYTRWPDAGFTDAREPLIRHVERLLDRIESEFLPGIALVRYGHGDWDDTLQPCRREVADRLVSSWTVALLFQTLERFAEVARRGGLASACARAEFLAGKMRENFRRWLMPSGVVAGFAQFPAVRGAPEKYLLHPSDRETGISYRLISMTRAILSGMLTPGEARRHADLIERHLTFPDGVRLTDRPIAYRGGAMRFFQRAETAAYFGREVALQYVHAHLRYVETLARLGRADHVLPALMAVTPIGLARSVPNAELRQSNVYFSSSDGAFPTRYEAARRFPELRAGTVGVKGGWRVYSSGPGLYFALTVNHLLGLRYRYGDLVIDPVLPASLGGLTVDRELEGRKVQVRYFREDRPDAARVIRINGAPVAARPCDDNPYRPGGVKVALSDLRAALGLPHNVIEVPVNPKSS